MTDLNRTLFREAIVKPPEGFTKILSIDVPAKISVGRYLVSIKAEDPKKITDSVQTKFSLDRSVTSALIHLTSDTFNFRIDPATDPLDRIATPGVGSEFAAELINSSNASQDPEQKALLKKILEDSILLAHELQGHLKINLNPFSIAEETELIWQTMAQCGIENDPNKFLDNPDKWHPGDLSMFYISQPAHELYALIQEELCWRKLEQRQSDDSLSILKKHVRSSQDSLPVRLLNFVIERTNNDLPKFQVAIERAIFDNRFSLSNGLNALLQELYRGVDVDDLGSTIVGIRAVQNVYGFTEKEAEQWKENHKSTLEWHLSNPYVRAALSTFMTVGYRGSNLEISFYTMEPSEVAMHQIPSIVSIREARKLLESRGEYPKQPMEKLANATNKTLELIADGTLSENQAKNGGTNIDVLKEFKRFYDAWHPALRESQRSTQSHA